MAPPCMLEQVLQPAHNLPREIMSFSDFPFIPEAMGGRSIDVRRYCCHQEVKSFPNHAWRGDYRAGGFFLKSYQRKWCLAQLLLWLEAIR